MTTAVIALSVVPYIANDSIIKHLKWFIVALPVLGVVLTVFGWVRLKKEIFTMTELKLRHRAFHKVKYNINFYPNRKSGEERNSTFSLHVKIYLASLLVLGVLNIIFLVTIWVPAVIKSYVQYTKKRVLTSLVQ